MSADVVPPGSTFVRLACVTARVLVPAGTAEERSCDRVQFSGVSESNKYELKGGSPFVHRRVIFSSHAGIDLGLLQVSKSGTVFRPAAKDVEEFPIAFYRTMFGGERGVDWVDQFVAKVDKKTTTVHSDVVLPINPSGEGCVKMARRWVPIKGELVYSDSEVHGGSLWASATSPLGNVYCLDFFANRADDEDGESVSVSSEVTVYWSE